MITKICLAFCLGIILATYIKIPFWVFYLSTLIFLLLSIVFLKRSRVFAIFILATTSFLGAAFLINSQILPSHHIAHLTPYKGISVYLKGIVESDPLIKEKKTTFILKAEDILFSGKLHKTCGKVLINVFGERGFFYGQRLIIQGKLYRPFNFDISERLNYKDYLRRKGIYSIFSVKRGNFIKYEGENLGNPIKAFAYKMKQRMKKVVDDNLEEPSRSILNAIILGERQTVPKSINDSFMKSGTIHILSVSGLHVVMVYFIMAVFLKAIRIPQKTRIIISILLLVIYAILTGARPPIVRATCMLLILLLGYLIQREPNIYNSLSIAALIILGINPNELFDIGFELSFISVIAIVFISPKIKNLFPQRLLKKPWLNFILTGFSVSSAALIGSLGLVVYYFKIITPVAIIANIIIVPLTLFIVALGFTLVIAGSVSVFLASIFAPVCKLLLILLFKINSLLITIPGAYFYLPSFPIYMIVVYYLLIVVIFKYLKRGL